MERSNSTITLSPRMGAFLTQVTETADLKTALLKVLSEYVELKADLVKQRIRALEEKWGMSFSEFSDRCETGTLGQNAYDYEVESDFWEWEQAETLLRHYEDLQRQWM
jgi:hypothetical protein